MIRQMMKNNVASNGRKATYANFTLDDIFIEKNSYLTSKKILFLI